LFIPAAPLIDAAQQVDHFNDGERRLFAFVARLGPGSLDGLLDSIDGKDAESDGNPMLLASGRNSADALARDILEVWRTATNDGTERDNAVEPARRCELIDSNRHFERARDAHDFNICVRQRSEALSSDSTMKSLKREATMPKCASRTTRSPSVVFIVFISARRTR
jgi:hypothetical protein